ncbi:hypothetical protein CWR40_001372 [Cronobacter sakazakii]|uniref:hypothetical protein n=1 Tax=Cronobacter TaxID=413496 RepID=UPI0003A89175|nr:MULTISPECIES: hypothetical protein [Cronobacter]AXX02553.1 hypothetical protein CsakCS09_11395 [Cronobacter sakazakii]EGT5183014.1 hypothetical protein [Cronobacter sakazakii]EGT5763089.1 hypothetical protein [Cronobacter sakazakii]EGT5764146.1 hypothetical protein [Cronobacter sakazakii]EIZ2431421.1 hypothetical protein [Cronobacter sakazakii]
MLNWKKRGLIYSPTLYPPLANGVGFAQSPQTLVFEDYVRIFFSTRERDAQDGKFVSRVCYVDMDKSLQEVIRVSPSPVIGPAELGAFDEHGIFPFNVLRHEGKIMAWTTGWNRRVSVSVDTAIGLAISEDEGESFTRIATGPVMAASLHEPHLVGDAFVLHLNGSFHMWYIFGTGWKKPSAVAVPERIYKIAHAISDNGIDWRRDSKTIIEPVLGDDECQALPTVIQTGDRYHMVFCFRECFDFRRGGGRGYRLGYAWSQDLQVWHRDDSQVASLCSKDEWDSEMQCYPHLFRCDGKVYLLYNGNAFGKGGFGLAEMIL